MGLLARIFGTSPQAEAQSETRAVTTLSNVDFGGLTVAGSFVSASLAENLSAVYSAVQIISESVATLPFIVYRKDRDGTREVDSHHPVARLLREPNQLQTPVEFIETLTAACLLKGNAFAEIIRDNRGAPVELIPLHPDWVSVLRIPQTRRVVYEVTDPEGGGRRRILADEMLHLKDRSDDGILGRSRLDRARESFGTALAVERHASSTFKNSATLSGVFSHPGVLGLEGGTHLRASLEGMFCGPRNAGRFGVLEEG